MACKYIVSAKSLLTLFRHTVAHGIYFRSATATPWLYFRRRCKMAAMQLLKVSNVLSIMQFLSSEPP